MRTYALLFVLAISCGGEAPIEPEALPEPATQAPATCLPHAHYLGDNTRSTDVFLLADGFSADGCSHRTEVFLGWKSTGSYQDAGMTAPTVITFDADGAILTCRAAGGNYCPFEMQHYAPHPDAECGPDAVDARHEPMPLDGCGRVLP